jgi:bifunctional DNase/RNase
LPIWIGPFEAEAITMGLQGTDAGRPLTHDLLRDVLEKLGAQAQHIHINALQDDTFFARVVLSMNGDSVEIDSRPSDAIALAVRLDVPIFVADDVMDQAGQLPASEFEDGDAPAGGDGEDRLEVFRDFVEGLNLDNLDDIAGKD